jgi:uncharacterized protein YraI
MKSSACGPTSAAIVVSSSKGAILPTTMASLSVANGYRTASDGTAWSYYSFVADYFDFNEFYTTSDFDTAIDYLKKGYYIIASCGSGLFTTNGHYIVLVSDNDEIITVYDPLLYTGKFETASRRQAGVVVSGNSVYVSESSFKNYANYKYFWIYSNDEGQGNNNTNNSVTNYTRYVATQSANLNVRNAPNGSVVGSLAKGTQVVVYETSGNWSRIGANRWVSTNYLSSSAVTNIATAKTTTKSGYTTGTYKTTANLNVRTGAGTKYAKKTYKQLTTNARNQNKKLGNAYYNGYKKGVVCTVTKINDNWGYTASGWICLDYCTKIK